MIQPAIAPRGSLSRLTKKLMMSMYALRFQHARRAVCVSIHKSIPDRQGRSPAVLMAASSDLTRFGTWRRPGPSEILVQHAQACEAISICAEPGKPCSFSPNEATKAHRNRPSASGGPDRGRTQRTAPAQGERLPQHASIASPHGGRSAPSSRASSAAPSSSRRLQRSPSSPPSMPKRPPTRQTTHSPRRSPARSTTRHAHASCPRPQLLPSANPTPPPPPTSRRSLSRSPSPSI